MRVCFLAEKPSALTVNGAYLGLADLFERYVELQADGAFLELLPAGGYLPLRFCFDEAFLLSPPQEVSLYYTERGVAVRISGFHRADPSLRVLKQERIGGALFTLAYQGDLKLFFNGAQSELIPLPDCFENCSVEAAGDGFLLRAQDAFALLSGEGKLLLLSEGRVLTSGKTLTAAVPFHDCLGHEAVCEWEGGKLVACTLRTAHGPTPVTFALAFFESLLIGADPAPFLADALKERTDSLKEYLGPFRSVVLTDRTDRVGLVYARRERIFDVRYFTVELTDGKISNLKPS